MSAVTYHRQAALERRIDVAAAAMSDGAVECDEPISAEVIDRAKRWLAWMVDVAFSTERRWIEPSEIERTCEGGIAFLWSKGERRLYCTVARAVDFFWFEGHPLWGAGEAGDASDPCSMQSCWDYFWR